MKKIEDITFRKFSRLVAFHFDGRDRINQPQWRCLCDCGNVVSVNVYRLRYGHTKSCGCLQKERAKQAKKKTESKKVKWSKERFAWDGIVRRCTDPRCDRFGDYGGRGIGVCDRWLDFESFYQDMGARPSNKHSIERMDNEKGYSPENCKWATDKEQNRNRRNNRNIEFCGKTQCLSAWAEEYGLTHKILSKRLALGWSFEKAITTEIRRW